MQDLKSSQVFSRFDLQMFYLGQKCIQHQLGVLLLLLVLPLAKLAYGEHVSKRWSNHRAKQALIWNHISGLMNTVQYSLSFSVQFSKKVTKNKAQQQMSQFTSLFDQ